METGLSHNLVIDTCPRCASRVELEIAAQDWACPHCQARGPQLFFDPLPDAQTVIREALPEDVACATHATKQATRVCAGTGDYICDLCAVQIKDAWYSVSYLDRHGQKIMQENFQRELKRPDRMVLYLLLPALVLFFFGAFAFPFALYFYIRMFVNRSRDTLYRRVLGGGGIATATFWLVINFLVSAFWVWALLSPKSDGW